MAEKGEPNSEPSFKVVDRRSGRGEEQPAPKAQADPAEAATPEPESDQVLGPIDFSTFLVSLASSALIHLGEAAHPETGQADVSLPHAQQTIDLLALLQDKTKGNLSDDEGKLLQALLRDLRLRFVQATTRGTKG